MDRKKQFILSKNNWNITKKKKVIDMSWRLNYLFNIFLKSICKYQVLHCCQFLYLIPIVLLDYYVNYLNYLIFKLKLLWGNFNLYCCILTLSVKFYIYVYKYCSRVLDNCSCIYKSWENWETLTFFYKAYIYIH